MFRLKTCLALILLVVSSRTWAADKFIKPGPVELTKDGRHWAEQTLKKLTLEEKVGQLFSVRYFMDFENFDSDAYRQFRDQMQKYHLGSVILTVHVDGPSLLKSMPMEAAAMTNQLQRDSKLPLLFAADFERGLSMRMNSVPIFPDAMAFGATGDPKNEERFGQISADESRAVGIQWDFWPTADVNINPQNPIINTRSFGEDPAAVGEFAAAFIRGAHSHGMLTSVKHFPGHGDTGTDSHLAVARVDGDLNRLQRVELPPFRKAIAAGSDSVMVAHLAIPALEPDPNKVATVSPNVIQGLLRKQLGFDGVIVTDAMEMRGLTALYPPGSGNPAGRAAVDALKAGNDVLLMPSDLDGAYQGVLDAVHHGDITVERLNESVRRILEMKASVGLNKARLVDLQQVSHIVGRQENLDFAQQVADQAVTVVRNNGVVLPLPKSAPQKRENEFYSAPASTGTQLVTVIISDNARGAWGRGLEFAIRSRRADATVFYVDASTATPLAGVILQAVKDAGKVVVATYVSPTSGKQVLVNGKMTNSVGLQQSTGDLLNQILEGAAAKTVLVAMGNPYLILNFPAVQNYVCSFSGTSSSELSVARVLFGEIQPKGVLPISLPGIADRGMRSLTLAHSAAGQH